MSTTAIILGESGTGKTASLRNVKPADCFLIQCVRKALPFRAPAWKYHENGTAGNMFVTDSARLIVEAMHKTVKEIVVIDDFQYMLSNEFMRRVEEKGYEKFSQMAYNGWFVLKSAADLKGPKNVYIFCHTNTDDSGTTRLKTIGKLLDEKITPEGLVPIVMRTAVADGHYFFRTKNNGKDTVKTPIGMFKDDMIDNDLALVDQTIREYYAETKEHDEVQT